MAAESISVDVAYATAEQQVIISISLSAQSTVAQAIQASDILQQFAEIDLNTQAVGIFGSPCQLDKSLSDGDRIEIYRPLLQDPKTARRNRLRG